MQVARAGRGRRRCIALRVAGGGKAEFARGRAVEQPRTQHAVLDQRELFPGDAFAVERMRAQPAFAQRVVDDANPVCEQFLAHLVSQEAGLARDRRAIDGAGKMRNQRTSGTRVEHDRHLARADLARVEPRNRPLCRAAADFFRRFQIAGVTHGAVVVVPFHAGAFTGDGGHRDAVVGAEISAMETLTGDQHHPADPSRG